MRIALLTRTYPPENTEGISRQRKILADSCSKLGHEIHVFTFGHSPGLRIEDEVTVHVVPFPRSDDRDPLRAVIAASATMHDVVRGRHRVAPFDIIDTPVWSALGWAFVERPLAPVVVWLQTTTAQLTAINGVPATPSLLDLIFLERRCVSRADGILGDSLTALNEMRRECSFPEGAKTGFAHLGLPDIESVRAPGTDGAVEALVVGRLEKRKGTPILLEALPGILREVPGLRVRFLGPDNSGCDGWYDENGSTYSEFFAKRHPELSSRVVFEGYVSEERLKTCIERADISLSPSLYESFGFTYLEGMRAGIPVVGFDIGAAREIFEHGELSGGVLCPPGDSDAMTAAIIRLAKSRPLRTAIGAAGRNRFLAAFRDEHMARHTLAFYQEVLGRKVSPQEKPRRVFQVMEALQPGDAVSEITMHHARTLAAMGQPEGVLSRWNGTSCPSSPYSSILGERACALIYHFWNYSRSTWLLDAVKGPKALYYHNITPPQFFLPGSHMECNSRLGYRQMRAIADRFDLLIGDSWYNLAQLAPWVSENKFTLAIHPVVDAAALRAAPFDESLFRMLRLKDEPNLLFVGRVARNKRQDELMLVFDRFCRETDVKARLWLVGEDMQDVAYREELERLKSSLTHGSRICFTGKVSDRKLMTYYRAADAFLCASEHEGFCVPLAQAMAFGVPVVARAGSAVSETVGNAGHLIRAWSHSQAISMLFDLTSNEACRRETVDRQNARLTTFSATAAEERFKVAIRFLLDGETHPWLLPSKELLNSGCLERA